MHGNKNQKIIKHEHTRWMTTARRKADRVFAEKRCEMWRWKQTMPMSVVGGACKDLAKEVGRQVGAEEISGALKDLGV
jgi:hypothetical protein